MFDVLGHRNKEFGDQGFCCDSTLDASFNFLKVSVFLICKIGKFFFTLSPFSSVGGNPLGNVHDRGNRQVMKLVSRDYQHEGGKVLFSLFYACSLASYFNYIHSRVLMEKCLFFCVLLLN